MGQYGLDRRDTEDPANLVSLRGDVHTWLDARGWTITPKATPEGYRYVAHVLDTVQAPEFFSWYHNVQLRFSGRQASEYIFARFAWTIIHLVKPFVISSSPRAVVHVQTDPEKAVRWVVETMQSDQLDKLYGGGGSRGASPNKRRKPSSTRSGGAHDDSLSRDAEINMLHDRITADHEARVHEQKAERATVYERMRSATKRRRGSGDGPNSFLEEWEGRGRRRKRRSWTADNDDGASTISTVASLDSRSTTQSDVDCHVFDTEHQGPCPRDVQSVQELSAQDNLVSHVDGVVTADVPPERSKQVPG